MHREAEDHLVAVDLPALNDQIKASGVPVLFASKPGRELRLLRLPIALIGFENFKLFESDISPSCSLDWKVIPSVMSLSVGPKSTIQNFKDV